MTEPRPAASQAQEAEGLDSLLRYLKAARGFDFTGYKRASLERRIKKRLDAVGARTYTDYEDYLEVSPEEYKDLFDTILIKVTGFFRDRPVWDFLADEVFRTSRSPTGRWSCARRSSRPMRSGE